MKIKVSNLALILEEEQHHNIATKASEFAVLLFEVIAAVMGVSGSVDDLGNGGDEINPKLSKQSSENMEN